MKAVHYLVPFFWDGQAKYSPAVDYAIVAETEHHVRMGLAEIVDVADDKIAQTTGLGAVELVPAPDQVAMKRAAIEQRRADAAAQAAELAALEAELAAVEAANAPSGG